MNNLLNMETCYMFLMLLFLNFIVSFNCNSLYNFNQKEWWERKYSDLYGGNGYAEFYRCKNDYIFSLIAHGFIWSFIVHFPYCYNELTIYILFSIIVHSIVHSLIENIRFNDYKLNLIQSQLLHILQILIIIIYNKIF